MEGAEGRKQSDELWKQDLQHLCVRRVESPAAFSIVRDPAAMSDFPSTLGELEWADEAVARRARREAARASVERWSSSRRPSPPIRGAAAYPPPLRRGRSADCADGIGGAVSAAAAAATAPPHSAGGDPKCGGGSGSDRTLSTAATSSTASSLDDGFKSRRELYREAALRSTGRASSMQHGTIADGNGCSSSSLRMSQLSVTSLLLGVRGGGGGGSNRSVGANPRSLNGNDGSSRSVGSRGRRRGNGSVVINSQRRRLSVGRAPSERSMGGDPAESSSVAGGEEVIEIEYMDEVRFEEMDEEAGQNEAVCREISPGRSGSGSSDDTKSVGEGSSSGGSDIGRTDETRGSLGESNKRCRSISPHSADRRGISHGGLDESARSSDKLYTRENDEESFGDFSVKLRKVQARICPECGYLDCQECCRKCGDCRCCSSAIAESCSNPSDRRLFAFVLVVTAIIIALPVVLRSAGGFDDPPPPPVGLVGDAFRPLLLPAYFENNLSDREDYRASLVAFNSDNEEQEADAERDGREGDPKAGSEADGTGDVADAAPALRRDLPLFWSVPLSASDFVQDALGRCHGLILASDTEGEADKEDELRVLEVDGTRFVNVDLTAPEGVARAARLDLAGSGTADVASTPLLHMASELMLSPDQPGRLMTLFRHPVRRIEAEYNLLRRLLEIQQAEDEGGASSESNSTSNLRAPQEIASLSLEEYAFSDHAGSDNYVTRRLVLGDGVPPSSGADDDRELTEIELLLAKELLRRKATVGLHDDLPGAVDAFVLAVVASSAAVADDGNVNLIKNDGETRRCVRDLAEEHVADEKEREIRPPLEEGSDAWDAIAKRNKFDVMLYEYATELYRYRYRGEGRADSRWR